MSEEMVGESQKPITLYLMGESHTKDDRLTDERRANIEAMVYLIKNNEVRYLAIEGFEDDSGDDAVNEVEYHISNYYNQGLPIVSTCAEYEQNMRTILGMRVVVRHLCEMLSEQVKMGILLWGIESEVLHQTQCEFYDKPEFENMTTEEINEILSNDPDYVRTRELRSRHYLEAIGRHIEEGIEPGNILLYSGHNHIADVKQLVDELGTIVGQNVILKDVTLRNKDSQ